jgi:protein-L-isoaspartate(D-aspartate) O-methyltransferase
VIVFTILTRSVLVRGPVAIFGTMAWRCSATTNAGLVANLAAGGIISPPVAAAMQLVDRANYCPTSPYEDSPQGLMLDQTISAPHMHGYALEYLKDHLGPSRDNLHVLDVGCGSGYLSAVLARLNPRAKVFGIDVFERLTELATANVRQGDGDLLDSGQLQIHCGDGWQGYEPGAPYDVIHVGAAAETMPRALAKQLKVGGRMFIPVGPDGGAQDLLLVDKIAESENLNEALRIQVLMGVRYVPLIRRSSD